MEAHVESFERLLKLDDEMRETFTSTAMAMWNKNLERRASLVDYEVTPQVLNEIQDGIIVTGSMAEGMATARLFKKPEISSHDGELEADVMFEVVVFPPKTVQNQYLEPIPGTPAFFKVKNFQQIGDFVPKYIRHKFYPQMFDQSGPDYLSGEIVKNLTEDLIKIRDEDREVAQIAAKILDLGVSDIKTSYGSEINGPAVTLSTVIKVKNDRTLLAEGDGVPCIRLPYWPVGEQELRQRQKATNYPSAELLEEIIQGGIHLVPKMSPNGCDNEEWRLSFSIAELKLAKCRSHWQRVCYMMFKSMYYAHIKPVKLGDTCLPSYFAKTIMYQACEYLPEAEWTKDKMADNLFMLFSMLAKSLVSGKLSHFFLPDVNLFDPYPKELLDMVKKKILIEIMMDPIEFVPKSVVSVTDHVRDLVEILKKLSQWAEVYQANESFREFVKKIENGTLFGNSDNAPQATVDMVNTLSNVITTFDTSKTTKKNLEGVTSQVKRHTDVLQSVSDIVTTFDKSKTTKKNLNQITSVLGAVSGFMAAFRGSDSDSDS